VKVENILSTKLEGIQSLFCEFVLKCLHGTFFGFRIKINIEINGNRCFKNLWRETNAAAKK